MASIEQQITDSFNDTMINDLFLNEQEIIVPNVKDIESYESLKNIQENSSNLNVDHLALLRKKSVKKLKLFLSAGALIITSNVALAMTYKKDVLNVEHVATKKVNALELLSLKTIENIIQSRQNHSVVLEKAKLPTKITDPNTKAILSKNINSTG